MYTYFRVYSHSTTYISFCYLEFLTVILHKLATLFETKYTIVILLSGIPNISSFDLIKFLEIDDQNGYQNLLPKGSLVLIICLFIFYY